MGQSVSAVHSNGSDGRAGTVELPHSAAEASSELLDKLSAADTNGAQPTTIAPSSSSSLPTLPALTFSSTSIPSTATSPTHPRTPPSTAIHGLTQQQYEALNALYDNEPARLQLYQSYVRPNIEQLLQHHIPVSAHSLVTPLLVSITSYLPLPPLPYYLQLQLEVQAQIQQQLAELELQQSVVDQQLGQQRDRANEQLEDKLRRRQLLKEMYADERPRNG